MKCAFELFNITGQNNLLTWNSNEGSGDPGFLGM